MVVLGVLAALLAFGVPRMNFKNGNLKSAVREISVLTRMVRNQARIKNRTFRIVFQMDEKASSYWVESADPGILSPSKASEERQRERESSIDPEKAPPPAFQADTSLLKKPKSLPPGFFVGSVETFRSEEPVSQGKGYVYFSAEGLVEKAAIQVTNRKQATWTLIVNPLTGHADVMEKAVRLKDASRE